MDDCLSFAPPATASAASRSAQTVAYVRASFSSKWAVAGCVIRMSPSWARPKHNSTSGMPLRRSLWGTKLPVGSLTSAQGVVGFKTGEPVAVVPVWGSCGHCPPCRRGEENFCYYISTLNGAGIGFDGGLAEYIVVDARFAVPMGDFDPVLAAPLTDAGLTTYTAMKPALPSLVPGTTAVVIGVGGLGLLAVAIPPDSLFCASHRR